MKKEIKVLMGKFRFEYKKLRFKEFHLYWLQQVLFRLENNYSLNGDVYLIKIIKDSYDFKS